MSSVVIKGLATSYGDDDVLTSLNLDIAKGEFVVLLGPSGCGKSTLLNCIAGLLDISAGQVFIDGKNVTWDEPKDRGIGMVFQSYALYPQMTVEKNLSFGLRVAGLPKKEVDERVGRTADILQIGSLLKRKPASLSGGQRQRVAIGRALVREVDVFLFDEPLSNLDAKLRTDLRIELKRLHRQLGNTMIYVTHDQVEALTLADRIAVMKHGRIQQFATPHEIYNRPINRFVADFIGSPGMNFLNGTLAVDAGIWYLVTPELRLSLEHYAFVKDVQVGQAIELGIRPEHIVVGHDARSGFIHLSVDAELVEPMGADTILWTRFSGGSLAIRTNAESCAQAGDKLDISFNLSRSSLFDLNGERL